MKKKVILLDENEKKYIKCVDFNYVLNLYKKDIDKIIRGRTKAVFERNKQDIIQDCYLYCFELFKKYDYTKGMPIRNYIKYLLSRNMSRMLKKYYNTQFNENLYDLQDLFKNEYTENYSKKIVKELTQKDLAVNRNFIEEHFDNIDTIYIDLVELIINGYTVKQICKKLNIYTDKYYSMLNDLRRQL